METFSALLALCAGNLPMTGEFPAPRPVTRSCDVFFDLRLNKRLSKQSGGWWFNTLLRPLWRHCNANQILLRAILMFKRRTPTHFYLEWPPPLSRLPQFKCSDSELRDKRWPCAVQDICPKRILNSNLAKSRSSITSVSVIQAQFWNFA